MMEILKRMAREALGADIPPEILAQMIPQLLNEMGGSFDDDSEEEDSEAE